MDAALEHIKGWLRERAGDLVISQGCLAGLDIGSYGLRAMVADLRSAALHCAEAPLPAGDAEATTAAAIALLHGMFAQHGLAPRSLARIGIGFGGPVDGPAGVTRLSFRQAGWERFPLAARFEDAFDTPVLVDNDATVTALAESRFGAGKHAQHLFYLHLSTGVGGGMVVNGRLYQGATTTAGEIGHAIVARDAQGTRTLEDSVSLKALLRRLGELGAASNDLQAVFADTPPARQVVAEAAELLGMTLSNVVALFDPHLIVVGGVVARTGGAPFLQAIKTQLDHFQPTAFGRSVPVVAATFGADSVVVGGLALAMESLED